jgi:hypothetical protein
MAKELKNIDPLDVYTLTGINLASVPELLDKQLPEEAYKAIIGGKGSKLKLTDIHPAYLPETLTKIFGLGGYGWGYKVLEMKTEKFQDKERRETFTCECRIAIWFRYMDKNGAIFMSDAFESSGGNTNHPVEWAMKGAVSNALGHAWANLGYQRSVYKGDRGHDNLEAYEKAGSGQMSPEAPHPNNTDHLPTVNDIIENMRQCKDLLSLKKTYFNYRGGNGNETELWRSLPAIDRTKVDEEVVRLREGLQAVASN